MADKPRFTTHDWRALVLKNDPDFHYEGQHPKVYLWPRGKERRDPGAGGGPYANHAP